MLSALDVSKYFLMCTDPNDDERISNLKLQKLLYYAQGFHLAMYGKPLFGDEVQAWTHGPVVPEVYRYYKEHGSGAIPWPDDFDVDLYDADTRELLDEVYQVMGQFSAWKLRCMTHEEPPWRITPQNGVISHKLMADYFVTQLVDA